jgi:hypothetical protein
MSDEDAKKAEQAAAAAELEKQSFLDRLSKESAKRKDAEKSARETEQQLAEMRAQLEAKESAGLPELEQVRKELERAQKRADEAEQRASEQEQRIENQRREQLVRAAATEAKVKYPELMLKAVDLDGVEDPAAAKRAVKDALKTYPDLVAVDPQLPGEVVRDGKRVTGEPDGTDGGDVSPLVRLEQAYAQGSSTP